MNLSAFTSNKKKVLFFSRGRGRGHAIPDAAIAVELQRLRDDVEIWFVSYGTGSRTLEQLAMPVIDLEFDDCCPTPLVHVAAGKLIGSLRPDLVVAHEEFAALPAAKIYEIPAVYITDWFLEQQDYSSECLMFANEILFIGEEGVFVEPRWVQGIVRYVGPVLRDFRYGPNDRDRARGDLGLLPATKLIVIAPGSWTERQVPTKEVILGAFDQLSCADRKMVWLAGADALSLNRQLVGRNDIEVLEFDAAIDRWLVAADRIVTKGSRKTLQEVSALGREATCLISRSSPANPIDLRHADSLDNVAVVDLDDPTSADRLYDQFSSSKGPVNQLSHHRDSGAARRKVAERLSSWLNGPASTVDAGLPEKT